MFDVSSDTFFQENHNLNLLELVLSVTGSREVQAVLSVPSKMTETSNQDLIRYRESKRMFPFTKNLSFL